MSARTSLTVRVEQYLAERRRLGFELEHMAQSLGRFASYVKARRHRGPLTVELMASWARQAKGGRATGPRGPARCACCAPSRAGCSSSSLPPRCPTKRSSAPSLGA